MVILSAGERSSGAKSCLRKHSITERDPVIGEGSDLRWNVDIIREIVDIIVDAIADTLLWMIFSVEISRLQSLLF